MYIRYRNLLAAVLLAALAACSPSAEDQAAADRAGAGEAAAPTPTAEEPAARQVKQDWRSDRQALGEATYATACASCHEAGEGNAPRTGVREDWSERSDLWQAVLFNHAKAGYLEMPGKGGQPELTDQAVEAAAEYMLGLTFPELPRD
jgi:cytochrome c5